MQKKLVLSVIFLFMMVVAPAWANESDKPTATASTSTPAVVVKEPQFQFEPVMEGTVVEHDFILENIGATPLMIQNIKTGCGCTTADYDKMIAPGESGKITIKANTRGYGGQMFSRDIQVTTNDPAHPQIHLGLSGPVEEFAGIDPKSVFLQGKAGDVIESVVTISPNANYPFHIVSTHTDKEIEDKIETILESKENVYALKIMNRLNSPGAYVGNIHLMTDNPAKPDIMIPVRGRIQAKDS
jgi:hypothetical protein